jgi:hypothetical protein
MPRLARFTSLLLAFAILPLLPARAQAQTVIKVATLAPEGSAWMNLFHEWGHNVEAHSAGKLKIKFYAGGVAGDERDAVRKMRLHQINAAAVTSIGLGLIQSEVRVLELPMLIKNYDELDYVRNAMSDEFRKKFEEKGYVLLGWGDVGPVHIFSNTPIRSKADLNQTKMWAWTDDPLVKAMFKQLGSNGVPLGVPDVLTSLQTGLINACYGSPLSMVAPVVHEGEVHDVAPAVAGNRRDRHVEARLRRACARPAEGAPRRFEDDGDEAPEDDSRRQRQGARIDEGVGNSSHRDASCDGEGVRRSSDRAAPDARERAGRVHARVPRARGEAARRLPREEEIA